jgi:hypothetical protein
VSCCCCEVGSTGSTWRAAGGPAVGKTPFSGNTPFSSQTGGKRVQNSSFRDISVPALQKNAPCLHAITSRPFKRSFSYGWRCERGARRRIFVVIAVSFSWLMMMRRTVNSLLFSRSNSLVSSTQSRKWCCTD